MKCVFQLKFYSNKVLGSAKPNEANMVAFKQTVTLTAPPPGPGLSSKVEQ